MDQIGRALMFTNFIKSIEKGNSKGVVVEGATGSGKSVLVTWIRDALIEKGLNHLITLDGKRITNLYEVEHLYDIVKDLKVNGSRGFVVLDDVPKNLMHDLLYMMEDAMRNKNLVVIVSSQSTAKGLVESKKWLFSTRVDVERSDIDGCRIVTVTYPNIVTETYTSKESKDRFLGQEGLGEED